MLFRCIITLHLITLLAGCSAVQTVSDAASNAYRTFFPKQQDTLRIGITADQTINPADTGDALTVMVRFYQLRNRAAFDKASYDVLLHQDKAALAYDALSADSQMIRPSTMYTTSMPLSEEAHYLGVVAFFRKPDETDSTWRLVIDRQTLLANPSLILSLSRYAIRMQPPRER